MHVEMASSSTTETARAGSDATKATQQNAIDYSKKTKVVSMVQIAVSIPFWIYAIINTVLQRATAMPVDWGTITFLLPLVAGVSGWKSVSGHNYRKKMAKIHMWFTVIGHTVLTLNYILGIVLGLNHTVFLIYSTTSAFPWAITEIIFTIWGVQWMKQESDDS